MSQHQALRRQAVPQQVSQQIQTTTVPAPTRGIILNENFSYMQPGGAMVCDNWKPTLRSVALRGGCIRHCDLHAPTAAAWANSHAYAIGNTAQDVVDGSVWTCAVIHTSAAAGTFAADRTAHPTWWTVVAAPVRTDPSRKPIISGFEYASGNVQRIFAGQATLLYDVTTSVPALIKSGQASGNYVASQLQNLSGNHMLVANDAGDYLLHYDGTTWTTFNSSQIIVDPAPGYTPPPSCATGHNLVYVWKYRNRFYFLEGGTMNAWYLPTNAFQGKLNLIPLSGAATKGGKLLWGSSWSIDAGDGIDDKCVFCTDLGELLIFTGSDPSDASNWRQEGRYQVPAPMGMNAHLQLGGDLLIATVEGIVPTSAAITKDAAQLDLSAITTQIKPMWRTEVAAKGAAPWTMKNWQEYGGIFVTWPGGARGNRYCAVTNAASGAWCRFVGYDAMCFMKMRADMFFGDQDGIVMQADRTGYDDGMPYVATIVGGWEMFQSASQTVTWRQARASFSAANGEPFQPQLSACTDYVVSLPTPPPAGPDPGLADVWDQGLWDVAKWDQPSVGTPAVRNTGWVSIGITGFSHAPVVQVTVAQQALPNVELISIAATYERVGITV